MRLAPGRLRVVALEGHGGLIAVVAVGDEQLLVRHQLLDCCRGADLPHAVDGAVLVGDLGDGRRGGGLIEQRVDGARGVRVQHEDRFEVRVGVLEQLHAVLLGTGEGLLVAEDDARRILFHLAERDEAFADQALAGIGHDEFLEVGEHAGFGIARPDAARDPLLHGAGGAGVDVFGFVIVRRCVLPGSRAPGCRGSPPDNGRCMAGEILSYGWVTRFCKGPAPEA